MEVSRDVETWTGRHKDGVDSGGGCHWTIRELGILTVGEGESIKWVFKFLEQIWCLNFKKLLYI